MERLERREERLVKRLERCKCLKCGKRFDASGVARWADERWVVRSLRLSVLTFVSSFSHSLRSDSSTLQGVPESPDVKAVLEKRNSELTGLKSKLQRLEEEKANLEATAKKLNVDAEKAQAQAQRAIERDRQTAETLRAIKDEGERQRMKLELVRNPRTWSDSPLPDISDLARNEMRPRKRSNSSSDCLRKIELVWRTWRLSKLDRLLRSRPRLANSDKKRP